MICEASSKSLSLSAFGSFVCKMGPQIAFLSQNCEDFVRGIKALRTMLGTEEVLTEGRCLSATSFLCFIITSEGPHAPHRLRIPPLTAHLTPWHSCCLTHLPPPILGGPWRAVAIPSTERAVRHVDSEGVSVHSPYSHLLAHGLVQSRHLVTVLEVGGGLAYVNR